MNFPDLITWNNDEMAIGAIQAVVAALRPANGEKITDNIRVPFELVTPDNINQYNK